MKHVIFMAGLLALAAGCGTAEAPCTKQVPQSKIDLVDQTQLQADIVALDAYLDSKAIVAVKDPSGVRYVITKAGDDTRPCLQSTVTVKYAGRLMNGTGFDAGVNPTSFTLGNLVLGWQFAFLNFGKGTKATLYIPSGYGYGPAGSGTRIPPNSNLIFDIELITFI